MARDLLSGHALTIERIGTENADVPTPDSTLQEVPAVPDTAAVVEDQPRIPETAEGRVSLSFAEPQGTEAVLVDESSLAGGSPVPLAVPTSTKELVSHSGGPTTANTVTVQALGSVGAATLVEPKNDIAVPGSTATENSSVVSEEEPYRGRHAKSDQSSDVPHDAQPPSPSGATAGEKERRAFGGGGEPPDQTPPPAEGGGDPERARRWRGYEGAQDDFVRNYVPPANEAPDVAAQREALNEVLQRVGGMMSYREKDTEETRPDLPAVGTEEKPVELSESDEAFDAATRIPGDHDIEYMLDQLKEEEEDSPQPTQAPPEIPRQGVYARGESAEATFPSPQESQVIGVPPLVRCTYDQDMQMEPGHGRVTVEMDSYVAEEKTGRYQARYWLTIETVPTESGVAGVHASSRFQRRGERETPGTTGLDELSRVSTLLAQCQAVDEHRP